MRRSILLTAAMGCVVGIRGADAGIVVAAQRQEDLPRLVLNTGGPIGEVRAAVFAADSQRVFAAGMDKSVQVWDVHEPVQFRSIKRTGGNRATLVRNLRWEVARGLRGVIYSLAVHPTDGRIAVGGYSARNSTGDIAIIHPNTGKIDVSLREHRQTLIDLSFSTDGKLLASVSKDGELRVWNVAPPKAGAVDPDATWTNVLVRPKRSQDHYPQRVMFIDSRRLLVAEPLDAAQTRWRLSMLDAGRPTAPATPLPPEHPGNVTALALGPKGTFASADQLGNVHLWSTDGISTNLRPTGGRVASALAFDNDRLFVMNHIDANKQVVLEMWDLPTKSLADQVQVSKVFLSYICAVSPNGSRLVVCDGDQNEMMMVLLKDREGKRIDKPLSGSQFLRLKGQGQTPYQVAFLDGPGYQVGFGTQRKDDVKINDLADLEQVFDLTNPTLRSRLPEESDERWRFSRRSPANWTVEFSSTFHQFMVKKNGQQWSRASLDPVAHGRGRSYALLTSETGEPYGLAIGTEEQNGIFVFDISQPGEAALVRYFRDHQGTVLSLSVSKDGKYLASGSADQTIKIWSLAHLRDKRSFSKFAGWGANFSLQEGEVVVTEIVEPGIAQHRGLRLGDAVVGIRVGGPTIKALGKTGEVLDASQPAEILQALQATPLHETVVVTIRRQGRMLGQQILLTPAWEPMASVFVTPAQEWAYWTPMGYYDASVQGDRLFGWQINRGWARQPDFFRADQFRSLEKPAVMKRLLTVGSVTGAVRQSGLEVPEKADAVLRSQASATPKVTIIRPQTGVTVEDKPDEMQVVASVDFPSDDALKATQLKAYVNGAPAGEPVIETVGRQTTVKWKFRSLEAFNRVKVVADGYTPKENFAFDDVYFRAPTRERGPAKLHLFALAAGQYPGDLALDYPQADATAIVQEFRRKTGKLYELGIVRELYEEKITRQSVQTTIDELKSSLAAAGPDDLLVIFLAGHGIADGNNYYFVAPDARLGNVSNVTTVVQETGITWTMLTQLASIPCRKVMLLDTCHSGNIHLNRKPAPDHWKSAIRPLTQEDIFVLAATAAGQPAGENSDLKHGIFTHSILQAFAGQADLRDDGAIDIEELAKFVEANVAKLSSNQQTPKSSPMELLEMIFIPMVQYR